MTCTDSCALGQIRTADTRFRRAVLYPLSYEGGASARVPECGVGSASVTTGPPVARD
jgi:hypothetical protein